MYIPWDGTRALPQGCTSVSCLPLPCLFNFSLSLISSYSNLPFRTQGRSWRLEGDKKTSVPRRRTESWSVSISQNEAKQSWNTAFTEDGVKSILWTQQSSGHKEEVQPTVNLSEWKTNLYFRGFNEYSFDSTQFLTDNQDFLNGI